MKNTDINNKLIVIMDSILFRVIILLLGILLLLFYGMMMIAAIINLPSSWFGLLYSLVGVISGILCFVYFKNKKKRLLVIIIPALIFMSITLINMSIIDKTR